MFVFANEDANSYVGCVVFCHVAKSDKTLLLASAMVSYHLPRILLQVGTRYLKVIEINNMDGEGRSWTEMTCHPPDSLHV